MFAEVTSKMRFFFSRKGESWQRKWKRKWSKCRELVQREQHDCMEEQDRTGQWWSRVLLQGAVHKESSVAWRPSGPCRS